MRRSGRVDVLIAVRDVVGISLAGKAVRALHLIGAGTFNAGGFAFVNRMVWFGFVSRLDGTSGHAILHMPLQQLLCLTITVRS